MASPNLTNELIGSIVERGARSAAQWMANNLVEVVSRPMGASSPLGPTAAGTFQWHPAAHTKGPYKFGSPEGTPPYMRTAMGRESIGWNVRRTPAQVRIRIGVDGSAPGGMKEVRSYLMAHEMAIARGGKERPWLRPTFQRYAEEFYRLLFAGMRG